MGTLLVCVAACSSTADEQTVSPTADTQAPSPTADTQAPSPTADDQAPSPTADDQPVPHHSFLSRPDLAPPHVIMSRGEAWTPEHEDADEYVFVTAKYDTDAPSSGALILDARGEPVWVRPDGEDDQMDLRVQEYRGDPVLTVYRGTSSGGFGQGSVSILDEAYEEITSVTTGGSLGPGKVDFHDTVITGDDTMLVAAYVPTPTDLTGVGGPQDGYVEDAVIQEVDIDTGEVLFEWSALEHVPVTDTVLDVEDEQPEEGNLGTAERPFDYFHINSITEDDDGSLLVSARHTSAVYRLDRDTGEVDWILGGSASDFTVDENAAFAWQHDAQRADDGTLTLFDNHMKSISDGESSRGLRLLLDEESMTASVHTEYTPPEHRPARAMANAQHLGDGNMFIGWGSQPHYSEYTPDGRLIYDACHGDACYGDEFVGTGTSYRAYKAPWEGRPATPPDVVLQDTDGERVAHVSWNGATDVAQWRLVTGEDEASASAHTTVDRDSFETAIPAPADAPYTAIEALDAQGNVLATGTPQE